MLSSQTPALILAPMDGLSDAPMRNVQGDIGAFTFSVAEFVRVSVSVPGKTVFTRTIPELQNGAKTPSGLSVQVQLLGGDPERMAQTAIVACQNGATAIDINFGCPAPTVNNHDGGATLLKYPHRIRAIVKAVREAVPQEIPVSAKLRLGWDTPDSVLENAEMVEEGGANWLVIHGRTRQQGYNPPVLWHPIGAVRARAKIPVVANGDIWNFSDFLRCQNETGCSHFMLGRGGIANPFLSHQIARALGIAKEETVTGDFDRNGRPLPFDWRPYLMRLAAASEDFSTIAPGQKERYLVRRLKQWLKIAAMGGTFDGFDTIKRAETAEELFTRLPNPSFDSPLSPRNAHPKF